MDIRWALWLALFFAITFLACSANKTFEGFDDPDDWCVASLSFYDICDVKNHQHKSSSDHLDLDVYRGIKHRDLVYLVTEAIANFERNVLPDIDPAIRFIVVAGDSDLSVDDSMLGLIDDPRVHHVFSQNCTIEHPKLTRIPIGMDYHTREKDESKQSQDRRLREISAHSLPFELRKDMVYVNVSFATNTERRAAFEQIDPKLIFFQERRLDPAEYLKEMASFRYVFSPHGNGIDCHRTWEALALGCVPIVQHSPIAPLFDGLPVLIVSSWSHLNPSALREFEQLRSVSSWSWEKLKMSYWKRMIYAKRAEIRGDRFDASSLAGNADRRWGAIPSTRC